MQAPEPGMYWKTVVDTIQDGVMIVNPEGTIVSVNRAFEEITGYGTEDIIGQSCHLLQCTDCEIVRQANGCHFCVMFERGELRRQKCVLVRKDGRKVHALKSASVIRDPGGIVIGAVETITDITDLIRKEIQIETYRKELNDADRFHGMIGRSTAMQRLFVGIANAAQSEAPVIIYGESGTGKEMVAHAIHASSRRHNKPYIQVNCAALNEYLLESELFGHVKGAYTGAHSNRKGRFEAAHGGDIFLDEIGDLPLSTQVKLLRVLEQKVVEPMGDQLPIHINVRVISATNQNMRQLLAERRIRNDFFYRINAIPINVPPLRDRVEDIPLLAAHFFNRIQGRSIKQIRGISKAAMDILMASAWPGNVRELRSALEFAFVACQGDVICPADLPGNLHFQKAIHAADPIAGASIDDVKWQRLAEALAHTGGNQAEAARLLGISRTSVWNQMRKYQINPKDYKR